MNQYKKLIDKQQKEFNEFPKFFAFDERQFDEGMKKLKLKENETDKILSIGAGGFIRKSDVLSFNKMMKSHKQEIKDSIKNDMTGEHFIKDMFRYELASHEYCITYNLEETLDALGLSIEEINNNNALKNGLDMARKEYLEDCSKSEHTEDEEFGD